MLDQTIVSQRFRDELRAAYPGLDRHVGHWRLLDAILFGTFRNGKGRRVLPHGEILEMYEDRSHRTSTWDLVERFSDDVCDVRLSGFFHGWATVANRARHVESHGFPKWVVVGAKRELAAACVDPVFFDTGKPASPQRLHEVRQERRSAADSITNQLLPWGQGDDQGCGCPKALAASSVRALLDYLNALPSGTFAPIRSRVPAARQIAGGYPECQDQQLRILRNVEMDPKPLYKPSSRTLRVFAMNPSLPILQSRVREELTADWLKADLRAAQLAIVARLWHVDPLLRRLEREDDIWDEIVCGADLRDVTDARAKVKKAIYATCFGMNKRALGVFLDEELELSRSQRSAIRGQSIFKALLARRDHALDLIKRQGYGVDAFGRHILPPVDDNGKLNYRSVLAQIAQSHEHMLMMPLLRLAKDNGGSHGFAITLWLHDGICVQLKNKRDEVRWKQRLIKVVGAEANKHGFPTRLVVS